VHVAEIDTPLGPMVGAATIDHLVLLEFGDRRMLATQFKRLNKLFHCRFEPNDSPVLVQLRRELTEFFEGRRSRFEIPLDTPGTPFQTLVWHALRQIPAGATRSYSDIARSIGRPTAVRAVARANGDNRIAIVIPCHRVIGSDGQLVGYGGGLWRKRRLLELEAGG
jgi:O-6-methylguanine DNA methyltransferase